MRTEAVLFDFDGVIADTPRLNFAAWRMAFGVAGVELMPDEYYRLEGLGPVRVAETLCARHHLPPGRAGELAHAKEEAMRGLGEAPLYPEIPPLLRELKKRGIGMAIVTGASRARIERSLPSLVWQLVDGLVTSGDVTHTKPHPEPYETGLRTLGCGTEGVVIVENAPLGIQAARAAHLYCVALTTTLPRDELSEADQVVETHDELSQWLLSTTGG